jgi:hypothetical protein
VLGPSLRNDCMNLNVVQNPRFSKVRWWCVPSDVV